MTLEALARKVVEAAESTGVPFMAAGALAAGAYGVPRSTRDVDLLVAVNVGGGLHAMVNALAEWVVFDTLTWGRRHVGKTRAAPPFKVELFELFDDPFVQEEFARRRQVFVPMLGCKTWLPTAEDVIVQKLRWGRSKDLDDVRDVIAVQGTDRLEIDYIQGWCARHKTQERLQAVMDSIPPI